MSQEGFVTFGSVTILTDDLVVFQGQIKHQDRKKDKDCDCHDECHDDCHEDCHHNDREREDAEFIEIELDCVPVLLNATGAALHFVELPIYTVNSIVRINVDQIISIGPNSTGCLAEA